MMGLGYLGSSSSSSASSNLSPLAPPFTVDRSNHNKPVVNSNSLSHLNDPSYFTSSWPYSHSSTARQKNPADLPRTSTLPSNDSGYMIPELGNLPTAGSWAGLNSNGKHGLEQITPGRSHWAGAVYPSPKRFTDSLSYNLSEAKPFYPPYASSEDVPLVTFSEPSYDLLSTSHGDETETSQVDYTRSLSGLEYNHHHQQDSVWSEGKQVKKMETDDSFFSEEANLAASLAYNNYLNQGGYGTETSSKSKDDASLFYYADIIRRANNTGPSSNGKSDGTTTTSSFSANNDLSKGGGSAFRAFPMFSECHPLIHSPEDVWNTQSSYNHHHHHPYEKRYQMFDCSDDHMITKSSSSSTLVIKPPASKSLEIGSLSALNINGHKTLKEKEQSGLGPNQLMSFQIGRTDADAPPCSTKGEEEEVSMSCVNEQLSFEFKARPGCFQVPEVIIPKVNVKNDSAAADSSSSSFEHQIDHHNNPAAAEDSPCWKGAPTTTSQFLPFEEESPQPPMKKLHAAAVLDHSFQNSIIPPLVGEQDYAAVKVGCCSSEAAATITNGGGGVHSAIKPNKDSTNSQIPKPKLPTQPEMDIISPDMMNIQLLHAANLTKAKQLNNSSGLVKSLYNLSDMLLLHCSNDEFGLKEHDLEALDHVIHNLGVCMSKQVTFSKQNSSNMSQEGAYDGGAKLQAMSGVLHDDQTQKPMSDSFGKNMEKLVENASLRGAAPKDDNMLVQAIKKVLDENLEAGCEVELPSLYKDLWLEAEAELCSLSFRARFERLKRDKTYKSKGDASSSSSSAIKEISSCSDPPKLAVIAHSDGDGDGDGDDVEAGVMARLSILKRREDPPNPPDVQVAAAAAAGIKDYFGNKGIQVPEATTVIGKDIDPWVMDRLNILKRRGELNANANANAIDVEEKEVRDCGREGPIGGHFQDEEEEEEEEAVGSGGGSDWEHILKDEFSWRLS